MQLVKLYKYLYFCLPRLRFLKSAPGRRYLDLGCGQGTALRQNLAIRRDLQSVAIDIQDFSSQLPADIPFVLYDGCRLPLANRAFEIVTVNHVFEHINDPQTTLSELKRILKPGGRLFIETPNQRSLWGRRGGRFGGTVHFDDDPTHRRPYSAANLVQLCRNSGFQVITFGVSRNMLHLILAPVLLLLGIFQPQKLWFMYARNSIIGWSSYVVVQK
jgi:SAM-dependent methyltransferase